MCKLKFFQIASGLMLLLPSTSMSQVINIRTMPLLTSEQFFLAPSQRQSMGGVEIAVDDELQDSFINPAKSRRLLRSFAFSAPVWHAWSSRQNQATSSSILSVPVGQIGRGEMASFGVAIAFQYLNSSSEFPRQFSPASPATISKNKFDAANLPLSLLLGMDIPGTHWAWGAGVDFVEVNGIDGVYLLYPSNTRLEQDGTRAEFRLGFNGAFSEKDEISLLGLWHTLSIEQEAYYENSPNSVTNRDRNSGWVARLEYRRSLWKNLRAGLQVTGNWKKHPHIPDYSWTGSSRDPGTRAFDLGFGLSWKSKTILLAGDAIYEPINANLRSSGSGQAATVHKIYSFANRIFRTGAEIRLTDWLHARAGSQFKFFNYKYEAGTGNQGDQVPSRKKWREIALTGGVSVTLGKRQLQYAIRRVTGGGLLTAASDDIGGESALGIGYTDFFLPPAADLRVREVPVLTHQLTFIYQLN